MTLSNFNDLGSAWIPRKTPHIPTNIPEMCVFTLFQAMFHLPPPTSSVKVGGQEVATKRPLLLPFLPFLPFRGLEKLIR